MAKSIANPGSMPLIARTLKIARYTVLEAWRNHFALLMAGIGEREATRILLGGLFATGSVTDTQARRFVLDRSQRLVPVEFSSVEISTGSSKPGRIDENQEVSGI